MVKGRPASETLDLALRADALDMILEQAGDMSGVGRCRDGDHRFGFRDLSGGG